MHPATGVHGPQIRAVNADARFGSRHFVLSLEQNYFPAALESLFLCPSVSLSAPLLVSHAKDASIRFEGNKKKSKVENANERAQRNRLFQSCYCVISAGWSPSCLRDETKARPHYFIYDHLAKLSALPSSCSQQIFLIDYCSN